MDSFYFKFIDIFLGAVDKFVYLLFSDSNYFIHPLILPAVILLFIVLVFGVFRFIFNLIYRR